MWSVTVFVKKRRTVLLTIDKFSIETEDRKVDLKNDSDRARDWPYLDIIVQNNVFFHEAYKKYVFYVYFQLDLDIVE